MRTRRLPAVALTALLALVAPGAGAQGNTEEMLRQAVVLYEEVQIERALALFRQVVSPSSPYEVSRAQRVRAYTYIGAALALQNQRDSAIVYFRAALERDPFTDLDPLRFTDQELAAFADARRRTFAVGIRAITADTVDPRVGRIPLAFVTTHPGVASADLRHAGDAGVHTLFSGETDGLREIPWSGVLSDGRLAPAGRYELVVAGRSRVMDGADSARVFFDLQLDHQPLEDTLPAIAPDDLLPEEHPPGAANRELMKGIGVALAAIALPAVIGNRDLGSRATFTAAGAGAGIAVGIYGLTTVRRQRVIPENIAANRLRQSRRAEANRAIRLRNEERLAQTRIIVRPAAGFGPDL